MATVRDILRTKGTHVVTVDRGDTVLFAAKRMNEMHIGAVVVTTGRGGVVGIFTERDVLVSVVGGHRDPATTLVEDIMTGDVVCATADADLDDCKRLMSARRIRHLPILDDEGDLLGIVTSGDVQAFEVNEQRWAIKALVEYIHGPVSATN